MRVCHHVFFPLMAARLQNRSYFYPCRLHSQCRLVYASPLHTPPPPPQGLAQGGRQQPLQPLHPCSRSALDSEGSGLEFDWDGKHHPV